MGRRRRAGFILGVAVVGATLGALATAGYQMSRPAEQQPVADAPVLATVERRVLVDSVHLACRVNRPTETIPPPESGQSAVVTGLPAHSPVKPGGMVAEVNGRPVLFLSGSFPLYRPLTPGDRGSDVRMLQQALGSLTPALRVSGVVDAPTEAALKELYAKAGYAPPPDAVVTQSELLVAPLPELSFERAPALGRVTEAGLATYASGTPTVTCTSPRLSELPEGAPVVTQPELKGIAVAGLAPDSGGDDPAMMESPTVLLRVPTAVQAQLPIGGFEGDVTLAETQGEAFVVPSGALAGSPASYTVTLWRDNRPVPVPVVVGVQSAGFVEVIPTDATALAAGDSVAVSG